VSLKDIELSVSYDTGIGNYDVVKNFYVPVLENSIRYDRVAGYFSSTVFSSAARGIAGLVRNGGKMRLVTSHAFTPTDTITFQGHFDIENLSAQLISDFVDSFKKLGSLSDSIARNHVAAMCWMLREGFLEIKVVIPDSADMTSLSPQDIDKFHPKFGIFYDSEGNQIAFSGSVNETQGAWKRNIENFDVYQNWIPGREDYVIPKIRQFEKYWNNDLEGKWRTIDLPDAVREKIIQDYAPIDFPTDMDEESAPNEWGLRNYQVAAVDAWTAAGRRGILEMATGTGKTRTAKACVLSTAKLGSLLSIVVAPYQHIGDQWAKELVELNPVFVSGDWRRKISEIANEVSLGRKSSVTLIAVKNTAAKSDFLRLIRQMSSSFENVLFIGDEVHWLGADAYQPALLDEANFRLGLSATPKRYFDEEGTDFLLDYFNGSVYELSLSDALKLQDESGQAILCPYDYHPKLVGLSQDELDKYREFTKKIARIRGIERTSELEAQLQSLYINRAAIAKSASSKIPAIRELLEDLPKPIEQCLIYCADFAQLQQVAAILHEMNIHSQQITGQESASASQKYNYVSEREHIIANFASGKLGVLLAIECLDEGVDIPSARIGIILASSGNTKEFIQRRGRLMRPFAGKSQADIYDFCVLPEDPQDPLNTLGLMEVELNRIIEFGSDALNAQEIYALVESKKTDRGV
jgi:superfamily II DNA or RNA helicase